MTFTKTFRRSGLATLAGVVLAAVGSEAPGGPWRHAAMIVLIVSAPVFAVSAFRHLMRGLLWRVGSRLLVSYLLLVTPLLFLAVVVYFGVGLIAAQVAGKRLHLALEHRATALEHAARVLADRFESSGSPAARRREFDEVAKTLGPIGTVGYDWQEAGGAPERFRTPGGAPLLPEAWIRTGPSFAVGRFPAGTFFAAIERRPGDTLVLSLAADGAFRAALERELGMALQLRRATPAPGKAARPAGASKTTLSIGGQRYDLEAAAEGGDRVPSGAPPAGTGPFEARWIFYPVSFSVEPVDWATGSPLPGERVLFIVNTSLAQEAAHLFGEIRVGRSAARSADVALKLMQILGIMAAAVFVLATAAAAVLSLRISRATRRLTQGVAEVEKGNFGHRVVLRGNDQLSRLVAGFNEMTAHLEASVAERAGKAALERELAVARDLQRRLLPPADFSSPGFEIAVDFRPAAAIGGDFYDLVAESPGTLTVVLADVSGHGLPTGIVMASAKASLTALLRSGRKGADLLAELDREIRRTTESRTFVTMAYLRFLVAEGRVEYTNAGHLYPYRVAADGGVSALQNPARPLGLELPAEFVTVTAPLGPGDVWVLMSDGIVEAAGPGADDSFGFARVEALLARAAGLGAAEVRDLLLAEWRAFTGGDEPADDRTLVVLRTESIRS
jgi:serine phosphatase RsbU (regulator of sigma subunit)